MEAPGFIAPFQQLHFKSGLGKHLSKGTVIIHDFVGKGRMLRISVSADLNHILIPFIAKVLVRNSYAQITAVGQILITELCGLTAFLECHVFPHMFRKESSRSLSGKHPFKICLVQKI